MKPQLTVLRTLTNDDIAMFKEVTLAPPLQRIRQIEIIDTRLMRIKVEMSPTVEVRSTCGQIYILNDPGRFVEIYIFKRAGGYQIIGIEGEYPSGSTRGFPHMFSSSTRFCLGELNGMKFPSPATCLLGVANYLTTVFPPHASRLLTLCAKPKQK